MTSSRRKFLVGAVAFVAGCRSVVEIPELVSESALLSTAKLEKIYRKLCAGAAEAPTKDKDGYYYTVVYHRDVFKNLIPEQES